METIHISKINKMIEKGEFSIQYVKKGTGELVTIPCAVCTSFHARGTTINILPKGEKTPIKLRRCLITKINEKQIIL